MLSLSRNLFFYNKARLNDSYETRIILMFLHFSILMFIFKKKGKKFDQKSYDSLFHNIENNLRELGFGDVSVNKKMKDLNKIFHEILLKFIDKHEKMQPSEICKFFFKKEETDKIDEKIKDYFEKYHHFCFDIINKNMIKDLINFKF